jgi:hypothetical protein
MLAGGADISTVSKLLALSSLSPRDVCAPDSVGQRAVDDAAALIALTLHSQEGMSTCRGRCSPIRDDLWLGVSLVESGRLELPSTCS